MGLREILKNPAASNWCIALFSAVLTATAVFQGVIIKRQVDVMRADERAWIFPTMASAQVNINQAIATGFIFPNTGKTPAKNISIVSRIEILSGSEGPTFDYSNRLLNSWMYAGIIVPSPQSPIVWTVAKRPVSGTQTTEMITFTQETSDQLNAGREWFTSEGIVTYQDIFDNWHTATYCFVNYNKNWGFGVEPEKAQKCIEYNSSN